MKSCPDIAGSGPSTFFAEQYARQRAYQYARIRLHRFTKGSELTPPKEPNTPSDEEKAPWWAENAPDEASLPDRFPDRPDGKLVDALRQQLRTEKATREDPSKRPAMDRYITKMGKSANDIGTYTLIPMMMLAGPAVGYILGMLAENQWGGAPWTSVGGLLFGLVAAFRQIFILLARKAKADKRTPRG
jgi:F0F1-type ATP synthase assembly protein I